MSFRLPNASSLRSTLTSPVPIENLVRRKRRAHGSGFGVGWLPIPGQELVEAAGGMTVGHALQDVSEPGKGLDVVELCGGDEGADAMECPWAAAPNHPRTGRSEK